MPAMSAIAAVAAAYGESLRAFILLGEHLEDNEWVAPTQCPMWSVADIYAHIIGPEEWIAEGGLPYDGPTQEWIDTHVTARRGRSGAALMADLRAVVGVRQEQLADAESQAEVFIPRLRAYGPHELGLRFRVFDLWTHEQDVRQAVNRAGNLSTASARITQELLLQSLPRSVAKVAAVPPGSTVRFTIQGELPADVAVAVDSAARGALVLPGAAPDLHLVLDWDAFARLGAGRGTPADYPVEVAGPAASLAPRVLTALNVAP